MGAELWQRGFAALGHDVRYGLRMLARAPAFTSIAVLTLALGIGANTAIFSIVNTVLLQPLPYPQADRLMVLHESTREFSASSVAYPNFQDWERMNHSFTQMAAYRNQDVELAGGGRSQQPEHLQGENVSADFFQVLGAPLLAGPGFTPEEDRAGGAPQAIVSYALWQRRFAGDPHLVGESIPLNGESYSVVGILPRGFWFSETADVFTPVGQWAPVELQNRSDHPGLRVVARLRPGVTLAAARADMAQVGSQLARLYPKDDGASGVNVRAMKENLVGDVRPTLLLLLGAVGLVLLIACANVANLMLARATGRRRELAVRAALGAGGARLMRQLLTESLLLAAGGGGLGLLLAYWGTRVGPGVVPAAIGEGLPRLAQISVDGRVLGFTLGAAVLSGILFGLLPAWQSGRLNLQEALKEGGRSATASHHRAQNWLAIAEVALSLMLLAAAGLLIESLVKLDRVAPGFDPSHVLTMQVALAPDVLTNGARVAAAHHALLERVNHLPSVVMASETSLVPLGDSDSENSFWQGGAAQPPPDRTHSALLYLVSPNYQKTMQIPLLRGRFLNAQDTLGRQNSIVIDDVLARHIFPTQNPIGQHLEMMIIGDVEIVGVVGHVKHWGLGADDTAKIRDEMYFPIDQVPLSYMPEAGQGLSLMVRAAGDPMGVLGEVRAAVAGPNRDQPVYAVQTMDQMIQASLAQQRFLMTLLGAFALVALTLAAIGIYGVLSYSVEQRTHEIGIRMALGARGADVVRMLVGQGARLAAIGAGLGVVGALLTTRLLTGDLYGVAPSDPLTLIGVTLLLVAVAVLASYIPARRAARVDPGQQLAR